MKKEVNCKICGKKSVYLISTYNEHSKTETLHHYRCKECGLVFVGNQVDVEEMGIAYATLDNKSYYDEIKNENQKKMESSIIDLQKLTDTKNIKIIDIGTGNGSFVELLLERGFNDLSVHEIPGSDLTKLKQFGIKIYKDYDFKSIPSNSFDIVTLLDVAEHVIDPRYLFDSCFRILKESGIIYLHTPVVSKMDRMMHVIQKIPVLNKIGKIWQRGRTSIFHLQNYTKKSLMILLNDIGFNDISIIVKNELCWPVQRYIKVYLCEKQGLSDSLAPMLLPLLYPFLANNFFNSNKAIVWATKL